MSYKIKPEDVPCDFVEVAEEMFVEGYWSHNTRHATANFLQAAIEAGIVSPPCHVKRHLGELECQGGTINPQMFIGKPKERGDEHWKGQTK